MQLKQLSKIVNFMVFKYLNNETNPRPRVSVLVYLVAEGGEGKHGQFNMLPGERDADDRKGQE